MISQTTPGFWALYRSLPSDERERARTSYRLWIANPAQNSLHFKCVNRKHAIWSVRVGLGCRVLGTRDGDTITWYWIGTQADYDRLIGA